jgi:serine phosphatase RsbU (regulator of sigma subunit)
MMINKTISFLFIFSFAAISVQAQKNNIVLPDTVNKFDEQGRKQGYWIINYDNFEHLPDFKNYNIIQGLSIGNKKIQFNATDASSHAVNPLTFSQYKRTSRGRFYAPFRPNEVKLAEGTFKNNLPDGEWVVYYIYSSKIANRINVKNGILEGKVTTYFYNGKINTESYIENGIEKGYKKIYDSNGKITREGFWNEHYWEKEFLSHEANGVRVVKVFSDANEKSEVFIMGTIKAEYYLNKKENKKRIYTYISVSEAVVADCKIKVRNSKNELVKNLNSDEIGHFSFTLPKGDSFTFYFFKLGFIRYSIKITTPLEKANEKKTYLNLYVKLKPLDSELTASEILDKPAAHFVYDSQTNNYIEDRQYKSDLKEEINKLSTESKELLSRNAVQNSAKEIETLIDEADIKQKELELLEKSNALNLTELKLKETELQKEMAEKERKEKLLELINKEKELQRLQLRQQTEELLRKDLESKDKVQQLELAKQREELQQFQLKNQETELTKKQLESEAKENEITLLNQEKEFQDKELGFQKTVRNYISAGLGMFLLLSLLIFRGYRQKRKANVVLANQKQLIEKQKEVVEKQKHLVEEKQKEIVDSINYAKRIQAAILPPSRIFKEFLPDSFIIYKPKDIVAGDFYWMHLSLNPSPQREGKAVLTSDGTAEEQSPLSPGRGAGGEVVFFAAADCTGHGVPGAMVSVICNNGLNRSVREYGLTDPGKILDKTREIVIQEFEKSDEEVKDGMDISLCALEAIPSSLSSQERAGVRLHYAGANNPLWVIRRDRHPELVSGSQEMLAQVGHDKNLEPETLNFELHEVKADKQPIGKYAENKPFTTHTLELQKGDSIYIFTDGFADQFGGEAGKKFKSANFKKLLLSIQDKSMEEQQQIITETFNTWKGETEQVDDVCVIGVRV